MCSLLSWCNTKIMSSLSAAEANMFNIVSRTSDTNWSSFNNLPVYYITWYLHSNFFFQSSRFYVYNYCTDRQTIENPRPEPMNLHSPTCIDRVQRRIACHPDLCGHLLSQPIVPTRFVPIDERTKCILYSQLCVI